MAFNKVIYNNTVLIDLTGDTVAAEKLLNGVLAHTAAGEQITGTLTAATVRARTTDPDNSVGSDGDKWIKVG